jgi:tyrosinase
VHGDIAIPYWDWLRTPAPPPALSKPALLRSWSVTRTGADMNQMPTRRLVQAVLARTTFTGFQRDLEAVHGGVHNAIGGDMMTSHSPADPIFFLHHANVDRLWAQWQAAQAKAGKANAKPPNANETLLPSSLFDVKVSSVLDIAKLGYSYR